MKKIILLLLIQITVHAQNVIIGPEGISTKTNTIDSHLLITDVNSGPRIFGYTAEGNFNLPSSPSINRVIFSIGVAGYGSTSMRLSSNIQIKATQKWLASERGTSINFRTKDTFGGILKESMIANHNGFIGIGTSSPKALLHILNGPAPLSNDTTNSTVLIESNNFGSNNNLIIASNNPNLLTQDEIYFLKKSSNPNAPSIDFISMSTTYFGFSIGREIRLNYESGNVSFGRDNSPSANVSVNNDFALTKTIYLTTASPFSNLNRNGASVINAIGSKEITGITDGVDGLLLYIMVAPGVTVRLFNENTNSLEKNRVITHTGGTFAITAAGGGATLIYDGSSQRWRVIGAAQ